MSKIQNFLLQDLEVCGAIHETYCNLYTTGHCPFTLRKQAQFQDGNDVSENADYSKVCQKWTHSEPGSKDQWRQNIFDFNPIYLHPKTDGTGLFGNNWQEMFDDDWIVAAMFYRE